MSGRQPYRALKRKYGKPLEIFHLPWYSRLKCYVLHGMWRYEVWDPMIGSEGPPILLKMRCARCGNKYPR